MDYNKMNSNGNKMTNVVISKVYFKPIQHQKHYRWHKKVYMVLQIEWMFYYVESFP